ncbi:hypothetical protein HYY74_02045 [Candidatus Woesearchaeota archaeon]|nr:hypothetical protein [Candidatus Woesearchaeota archaeon]
MLKAAAALLLFSLLFIAGCAATEPPRQETPAVSPAGLEAKSTGSTGDGDVLIELTPKQLVNGLLEVDVAANTHSVDLSQYDLGRAVRLVAGGKEIFPESAPQLSGHHASGIMRFNLGNSKEFTIMISGIPKEDRRIYSWALQ